MLFSDNYPGLPAKKGEHDNQNWNSLKDALELNELINCGIGGAQWQDRGDTNITDYPLRRTKTGTISNELRMLNRLISNEGRIPPDIILIIAGTNNPVVDGDFNTVMGMTFSDLESNEKYRQTMFGGLRYSLEKARNDYPNSEIYLVTPLQSNTPSRSYDRIKSTGDAIKLMGARYSCIVFDAAAELGIVDLFESNKENGRCLKDGVHLNAKGKEKFTRWITKKIIQSYY